MTHYKCSVCGQDVFYVPGHCGKMTEEVRAIDPRLKGLVDEMNLMIEEMKPYCPERESICRESHPNVQGGEVEGIRYAIKRILKYFPELKEDKDE